MDIASASNRQNTVQITTYRRDALAATDFRWCTSGPSSCWVRRSGQDCHYAAGRPDQMRWGLAL